MKTTIAIPTYNRSNYIGESIASVLGQTDTNFELLIVDNASTDNTQKVVKSFTDDRIRYIKNKENIGIINNWNKCVSEARGKYLMILGDDDVLHKDFLRLSVEVHNQNENIGFTFSHCNKVDSGGSFIQRWGYDFVPAGFLRGPKYLFYTLDHEACLTNSSTVLLKKEVFNKLGNFQVEFARNVFDFNMWVRIASQYDVFFIDKILCDYRIHSHQVSQIHWGEKQTGKIGSYLELLHILSILQIKNFQFENKDYVAQKLDILTKRLGAYLMDFERTI